jgi:quercetin dioxygenase-like cupin family protein
MNPLTVQAGLVLLLWSCVAFAQDVMQFGVAHLKVLAEDDKVRVLKYTPKSGDKTPMHSHPASVIYIIKGGRLKITSSEGKTTEAEIKTGDALLRPPVTHADEAVDSVEAILIELKQ